MKKKILSTVFVTVTIVFLVACSKEKKDLNFQEKTIQTEFGNKIITIKINGNQSIFFTKEEFKEIQRYIPNLNRKKPEKNYNERIAKFDFDEIEDGFDEIEEPKETGIKIKIKIGARKYNCKKGIGFRCGVSGGPYAKVEVYGTKAQEPIIKSKLGRNPDRSYDCIIKEINGKYEFEFIEIVDWDWLEKTEI